MGLNCGCPAGEHLADLTVAECKESMGQIQKIIFQRVYKASGELNGLDMSKPEFLKKASWTVLFSAADSTKMIITPYIQGPTTEPGAARLFGGGNQSLGGVETVIGREPTTFSAIMYQEMQITIATLKTYMCENVGIFFIDEYGNIGGAVDNPVSPTKLRPIPIGKLFIGDKKLGGFEEPDSNTIEFSLFPNWSDNLVLLKKSDMDFNPLTDLVNLDSIEIA